MRKKLLLGRTAAFVMAAAIAAGNTVPVQAKGAGEQRREAENLADGKKTHEDKESFPKASPSEPEEERGGRCQQARCSAIYEAAAERGE